MAYEILISAAQSKKLYGAFGSALLEKIFTNEGVISREGWSDLRPHLETALTELLSEVGKQVKGTRETKAKKSPTKATKVIKSPKEAKKPKSPKGPSKNDLKKQALTEELTALGGEVPENVSVMALRKAIAEAKKAVKAAEKAKKVAKKSPKKVTKAKKSPKSPKGPSKMELKKQELNKELVALGGTELEKASVTELRKAITEAKKAAKVAKKSASPKVPETTRRIKTKDGFDVKGNTGKFLRVAVNKETREVRKVNPEVWTAEGNELFDFHYPTGMDVKKTKTPTQVKESSQNDLIAALVSDAATKELMASGDEEVTEEVTAAESDAESDDELSLGELTEEEIDSDDDEPVFDENDVESFEHDSRPGENLYIDSEFHVWSDEQELIGTYDAETKALFED